MRLRLNTRLTVIMYRLMNKKLLNYELLNVNPVPD